ncbi:hypothetical protein SRHO_G00126830 [Serrasalmus rhombeus]
MFHTTHVAKPAQSALSEQRVHGGEAGTGKNLGLGSPRHKWFLKVLPGCVSVNVLAPGCRLAYSTEQQARQQINLPAAAKTQGRDDEVCISSSASRGVRLGGEKESRMEGLCASKE